jgi:hypothetical protein
MANPANNEMIFIFCFEKVDKRFGLFFQDTILVQKKSKKSFGFLIRLTSITYLTFAYLGFPLTKGFPFT